MNATVSRRLPFALVLTALLVLAGCLGASGESPKATSPDVSSETDAPTDSVSATTRTTASALDCPDEYDRYRDIARAHVADETGSDPANVTVRKESIVDYPVLGECYYHAKVQNTETGELHGAFVADNGTVADYDAVEARAERAYERRYGNLSRELYRRVGSVDADERLSVTVHVAGINESAIERTLDRETLTVAEYKEALSAERERRAENKTAAVVADIRTVEGATVEGRGSLRIDVTATPTAIEEMQRLENVTWITLRRETTMYE